MVNASTLRLQRAARATVIVLLVSVNAVLVLLMLQKYDVVPRDRFDLESMLGLGDERTTLPKSIAFGVEADGDGEAIVAEPGADWPGGAPDVPADPPAPRLALLDEDGSLRLTGAVPSWEVATRLAAYAGARLPAGEDAVSIDYSWHPDASEDGRDGVVRLADPLLYDSGQATVPLDASARLDAVAEILIANPSVVVVLIGHTDDFGESLDNSGVAFARANAVSAYLEGAGVSVDQVVIAAPQPGDPVASNRTDDGRRLNRRLEIELENLLTAPSTES